MFNEPPKLFNFTNFDVNDIIGDPEKYQSVLDNKKPLNNDLVMTISE